MKDKVSLSPDLLAALSVIPEASRDVKLRGHDVTFHPIPAGTVALWFFEEPEMAVAFVGVHIEGGKQATEEEVKAARENMPLKMATKIIVASTRAPDIGPLVANLTETERSRCVNTAMALTTGGDVAGFFGDVRLELETIVSFVTAQQSKQTAPSPKARPSTTVTRSSSSSKRSKRSRSK